MGRHAVIVADTHALIWFVQGDPRLGPDARALIERTTTTTGVLVCAISIWEIAMLVTRQRVELGMSVKQWVRRVLGSPGFDLAPLNPGIAIRSAALSWSHKDPADRMIVATALEMGAPLLTADRLILAYVDESELQSIDAAQ